MKNASQIAIKQVESLKGQIGTKAPSTRGTPSDTAALATWLAFQTHHDPQLSALVNAVGAWCRAIKSGGPPRWITLLGRSETGKTHIARKVWAWLKARGEWSTPDAVRDIECLHRLLYWPAEVDSMRNGEFGFFRDAIRWPFLVIDDIGAERDPNGFAAEKLNTLLGSRVGRWTMITGNMRFADVAKMDERIASRMTRDGSVVVELTCRSFGERARMNTGEQIE